ncbi:uncharacterized protein [Drosophila bipectinata]|uniref:uncharacterized protein n=1 Tax=Drosophila bipectinata TaxID=42026 RepID=UPI001C8909D7|nr:uncharacterized protein LOC108130456 [Drosophila bipectinata]
MCSSAGNGLIVEGIPLGMGRQFTPRLTMKRVYNTKCFRPERYRHEVANHYRDYKLQQHLHQQHHISNAGGQRRRRRRRPYGSETTRVPGSSLASACVRFRDVWPTHVHNFPRFDDTFTSRGRRTVCSGEPPDEPYNDAVRRIRSSQSCSQLRQLVQRQLLSSRIIGLTNSDCETEYSRPWSSRSSHGKNSNRWRSQSSDNINDRAVNYQLNINNIAAATTETQQSPNQNQQPVDFYGYLQLASGYYEHGVLANIAYLESIGRQKHHNHHHHRQQQLEPPRNAIKAPLPGLFLDTPSTQALAIPGQKLTGRLLTLLKSLKSKVIKRRTSPEPGIRVDIRNLKTQEDQEENPEDNDYHPLEEDQQVKNESSPSSPGNSMCDYYAEDAKQVSQSRLPSSQTLGATSATLGATVEATAVTLEAIATRVPAIDGAGPDHRCIYEIIDNLSHLSIGESGERRPPLPQITLTDCTAQQVALYSASFDIIQLQIPNEARPPNRD